MLITIQLYRGGIWMPIARFLPRREQILLGYAGCGGYLEYDSDYVTSFFLHNDTEPHPPVSLPVPVDFLGLRYDRWPAFLLDLMPTGAGRRGWLGRLNLSNSPAADWELLTKGAHYPVGWLKVVTEEDEDEQTANPVGFSKTEVSVREEAFLEYMIAKGASAAGSSDVQGESPKLLLTEDHNGLLYADGALPDCMAAYHWLVKFTRARTKREQAIISNEGPYLKLARILGANVHDSEQISFIENKALFIPRFDRHCTGDGTVQRFGMESFASAAGIAEFGVRARHEDHCILLATYSTSPTADMLEYLRRDILNVCLGNPDNHARNHAFLKKETGEVRLSPLYDLAPMFLSDEGYARVVRWDNDKEKMAQPDWLAVGRYLVTVKHGPTASGLATFYDTVAQNLSRIFELAREAGVDETLIELRRKTIKENRTMLLTAAEAI